MEDAHPLRRPAAHAAGGVLPGRGAGGDDGAAGLLRAAEAFGGAGVIRHRLQSRGTGRPGGTLRGSLARAIVPIFNQQETVVSQLPLAGVTASTWMSWCVRICISTIAAATRSFRGRRCWRRRRRSRRPRTGRRKAMWRWSGSCRRRSSRSREHDLFGDGRIVLLPMPGHTPGTMAARVVLDRDGTFVLASDAAAVRAHRRASRRPACPRLALRAPVEDATRRASAVACGHP